MDLSGGIRWLPRVFADGNGFNLSTAADTVASSPRRRLQKQATPLHSRVSFPKNR
jgi:hypothetical protein